MTRVVAAVPTALVVAVSTAVALGEGAALVGLRPLAHRPSSVFVVLAVLAAAVLAGMLLTRGLPAPRPVSLVPAGVLVLYGIGARFLDQPDRVDWFLGGDHLRHVVFAAQEQGAGALTYADETYPRGWHTLVSALWTASGGTVDAAGLRSLVDLQSTLSWCLPVVLAVATASLATALAVHVGLGRRGQAVAGLVASAGVLSSSVLANYQALGFENSWVAAVVTAVAATEVVARRGGVAPIVVCGACVVVVSHSWQLLLPGVVLALVLVAWPPAGRAWHSGRRRLSVAAVGVATLVLSWPGLVAVVTQIGLGHATDSDVVAPIPLLLLAVGLLTTVLAVARSQRDLGVAGLAAMVVLPSATALGVALVLGISVTDYYPSKLVWHTAVLGLAPTGVGVALLLRRLLARDDRVVVATRVVGVVVGVVAAAYLALVPLGAFLGTWSPADGRAVLAGAAASGAGEAQVAWVGTPVDDAHTRILLAFYLPTGSLDAVPQEPIDVDRECDLLRESARPAVVSDRPAAEVRARYACVPAVEVVPTR